MSKAFVHWARQNRRSFGRAYELLVSFGLDHELVERSLLPRAVRTAQSDFLRRAHGRRVAVEHGRAPWTSCPDPAQTLQLAIFRVLSEADDLQSELPDWYLVRYVTALVAYTAAKSAFYVAVGIGGVLSNGRTRDILELYDSIGPNAGQKSPRQVSRVRTEVSKHLGATLGHLVDTNHDGVPTTTPRPRTAGDEFHGILQKTIPWDTDHVPQERAEYLRVIGKRVGPEAQPSWDMAATHVLLDQRRCFELVRSWNPLLKGKFDQWLLPRPHRSLVRTAGFPRRPSVHPARPPDDNELFAWIVAESSCLDL